MQEFCSPAGHPLNNLWRLPLLVTLLEQEKTKINVEKYAKLASSFIINHLGCMQMCKNVFKYSDKS